MVHGSLLCDLFLLRQDHPGPTSARRQHAQMNSDHPRNGGKNQLQAVGHDDDDLVSVAKRVKQHSGTVLVTMINDAYLSFTYSWLCNTKGLKP